MVVDAADGISRATNAMTNNGLFILKPNPTYNKSKYKHQECAYRYQYPLPPGHLVEFFINLRLHICHFNSFYFAISTKFDIQVFDKEGCERRYNTQNRKKHDVVVTVY